MKTLFLVFVLSLFTSSSYAEEQQRSVIVMFGDSITVGYNSGRQIRNGEGSTTLSGPTQFLSDALNNSGRSSTVVNWGEGGTSTARGLQRISGTLSLTRGDYPDDRCIVLLMYGTNDFGSGIGSSTTVFNTREMIRQIRAAGCTPVVGNLTPRSDRDLASLSSAVGSIAASENAMVVNHFSTFTQKPLVYFLELEVSGITGEFLRLHPNEAGYQLIVTNWFGLALSSLIAPFDSPLVIAPIIQLLLDE